MGIRTGAEYVVSLRDGRRLFIDGRQVEDVTAYAPMRGVIDTLAALHDEQFDPALRGILTHPSPTSRDLVSTTYLEARTEAEFQALAGCFHLRALRTYGLMGRLTDFMSGFLMDLAGALRVLGKEQAAARAQHVVEVCREGDLQVTHALIDPQSDRSTLAAPAEAVHVVERTREGVVVSGCRMLSTLAPVSNVCYVGPYYPRQPGEERYALAFLVAMNAPGLTILGRESFHHGESRFDRPLSSRFDEGDAILVFDRVTIPHDWMIVDGDMAAHNGLLGARPGYTAIQACTRGMIKLRFLTGLATAIARANGRDKTPRFQAAIGELAALVGVADGIRTAAISNCRQRVEALAAGRPMPRGDGLTAPEAFGNAAGAAVNFFFPHANTKAADVLRMAAGSGVLAMTQADYANPEIGPLMDRWLIGPNTGAEQRLKLMKLAWDLTGTEFGSRAGLYERLYSGDPEANARRWFQSPVVAECEAMVARLLES